MNYSFQGCCRSAVVSGAELFAPATLSIQMRPGEIVLIEYHLVGANSSTPLSATLQQGLINGVCCANKPVISTPYLVK